MSPAGLNIVTPPLTYAPELKAKHANLTSGVTGVAQAPSFANQLRDAVESVNAAQINADDNLRAVAAGQDVDLHATMIALEEADISLRAMTSVRDKVVEAYERVMNMSI